MHPAITQIIEIFETRGCEKYGTESVTQLEHALQSADLARQSDADEKLIAAALLHDIGHILHDESLPTSSSQDYDDDHESLGYQFLLAQFGAAVADPVRLHVAAKRYLCTKNPDYKRQLSPTSYKSYQNQGGTMSEQELSAFEAEPHFREALRLRHWDDIAKRPDIAMPEISDCVTVLENALVKH